jgi:hypothetical protein
MNFRGIAICTKRAWLLALLLICTPAFAEPGPTSGGENKAAESKTNKAEEDDFSGTPFTEYGEFNESAEEEEETRFLKYGRFFGVSLGLGFEFVDGNRGALWQGGFPMFDFKLHYWFDFNLALDIGFFTAQHFFDTTVLNQGHVDINMLHVGVDIKYYFDTKNLSAPISFANPYILLGAGTFSKTQNSLVQQSQDSDISMGLSGGAGLEFAIVPKKTYFAVEGKMHVITFKDTYSTIYQPTLENLSGFFYTFSGSVLFTW